MFAQIICYIKNSIVCIIYNCLLKFVYGNIIFTFLLLLCTGPSEFGVLFYNTIPCSYFPQCTLLCAIVNLENNRNVLNCTHCVYK